MFMDWKNQYSENEYTTESNLQTQCNPYQATSNIFHRTEFSIFNGHLMRRVDSLEKTLMLGGIGGRRRRGRQRMRWLDGITDSMDVESE